jgi:hypothetical protein
MSYVMEIANGNYALFEDLRFHVKLTDGFEVVMASEILLTLEALQQLQETNRHALQDYVEWCQGLHNELSSTTVHLILGRHLLMNRNNTLWVSDETKHIVACAGGPNGRLLDPETGKPLTHRVRTAGLEIHHLNH